MSEQTVQRAIAWLGRTTITALIVIGILILVFGLVPGSEVSVAALAVLASIASAAVGVLQAWLIRCDNRRLDNRRLARNPTKHHLPLVKHLLPLVKHLLPVKHPPLVETMIRMNEKVDVAYGILAERRFGVQSSLGPSSSCPPSRTSWKKNSRKLRQLL